MAQSQLDKLITARAALEAAYVERSKLGIEMANLAPQCAASEREVDLARASYEWAANDYLNSLKAAPVEEHPNA